MKFLNSKDKKGLYAEIKEIYGIEFKTDFILYEKDNSIYLISGEYSGIKDSYNEGLEFAYRESEFKNRRLILTIEGLNITKPKKNIIELDEKDLSLFLQGKPFILEESKLPDNNYAIRLKGNSKDYFGIAKLRNSVIHSTVPMKRRLKTDVY